MGDVQVVVGYGMEGNIIGSSLVDYWIENDKDYYFFIHLYIKIMNISI